ncbi:hypothetical protein [Labrenzia sp. DG1229]|uniref:hypothetical protein n=1 Tax=Labrenzia sp. DG1229 TaxID=681847 RepID=UPI0006893EE2|nr:hypothetical protein [Labrenzia sp. DG1229]
MHTAEQTTRNASTRKAQDDRAGSHSSAQADSAKTPGAQPAPSSDASVLPCNEKQARLALTDALESAEFRSAPQLRSFLEFVVHASLENKHEKIKGYTIAVEALGRATDFNPVTDPIVRVEAARLRRRLTKYYEGSGASSPVRITIPKGSYAPAFTSVKSAADSGTAANRQDTVTSENKVAEDSRPFDDLHSPVSADGQAGRSDPEQSFANANSIGQENTAPGTENAIPLQVGSQHAFPNQSEDPLRQLLRMKVSLPIALALAAGGFLAGLLVGA